MRFITIIFLTLSAFAAGKKCSQIEAKVDNAIESQKILAQRGVKGEIRGYFQEVLDSGVEIDPKFFQQLSFRKGFKTNQFDVKAKRMDHVQEHMESLGAMSEKQYKRMAHHFAGSSDENIISFRSKNEIYRYNPMTNEYLIIGRNGKNVSTYFKPDLKKINATRRNDGNPEFGSVFEWLVRNKWDRYNLPTE